MDIKENIKGTIFKICIVFFSLCTFLWFSVFSYGILYYLYIPAVAHTKPVHLQYDMSCSRGKVCHHQNFPFDNLTLIEGGNEFLRGSQGYTIELVLEMPESEHNLNQGMFMIKLDMIAYNGKIIKSSCRPALLRYRSALFKLFYTIFFLPGLLAGSFEEKQSLTVPLFEKYVETSNNPAHFAYIEVQALSIEVYSSTLRIHAQFTGLRYLMYYWPVMSSIIGIGGNFLFLVVTIGLIWIYETAKRPTVDEVNVRQSPRLVLSIRKKAMREKSVGFQSGRIPELGAVISSRIERENVDIENLSSHSAPGMNPPTDESDEDFFDSLD